MHPSSLDLMREAKAKIRHALPPGPSVLDVGGRSTSEKDRSYRDLWPDASLYWVVDLEEGPNVNEVMGNPYRIMADNFDVVVCGQTLEHVANPFRLVAEMVRVLNPGGYVILIAPSAGYVHRDPIDCWRFYPDAFQAIADEVGLETVADWIYKGDSGGGRGRLWDDHVFVGRKPCKPSA